MRKEEEMTRSKVAVLGLSALALLATGAFVASGAQATGEHVANFTCLENDETRVHCTADGEQAQRHNSAETKHKFEAGFATMTCTNVAFAVTTDADGNSTETSVEPLYDGCSTPYPFGPPLVVLINMNGCEYEFHIETNIADKTTGQPE